MADYGKYYEARGKLVDILRKDFIGPVKRDELLWELPTQYYILGKLYPQRSESEVLAAEGNEVLESEAEAYSAAVSLCNQRDPSSLGLTFAVRNGTREIVVRGGYAFYEPLLPDEARDMSYAVPEEQTREVWLRREYTFECVLSLAKKAAEEKLEKGLRLFIYVHDAKNLTGGRIVTASLINDNTLNASDDIARRAALCAFQVKMEVLGRDGAHIFEETASNLSLDSEEQRSLGLLYRDVHTYAQGHGCAAAWDAPEAPERISVSWLPMYELCQMVAATGGEQEALSMRFLANGGKEKILSALRRFADRYLDWIKDTEARAASIEGVFKDAARSNMRLCHKAQARILHAVELLRQDEKAMRAFCLANEAMLLSREQTIKKAGREFHGEATWYPFQLAFILQELPSFITSSSEERELLDLLFFPTGGGKTEAYLGLTAFVIFLRRLRDCEADGVTVIMRYTLRLLTLQQFERASLLICACELLRRRYKLGGKEISIGLWVGGKLTPNKLEEARTALNKERAGATNGDGTSPRQLMVCPWCGGELGIGDYAVDSRAKRMAIRCPHEGCEFTDGLPVHLIDDAIYEHKPSFIVATLDKFAQLPLNGDIAALFGREPGNRKKAPELIIQDELHLISGPLGTVAGIYEAAVDKLCESEGVRAKVIASTATIRNAASQVRALYDRDFAQFPPPGITANDSYFAMLSTPKERPSRAYLGVMGIGLTATSSLIRVNAALLFATRYLAACGYEESVVDNFWTIVDYFNALRELGAASTQILDSVQSRFTYLAETKFGELTPKVDATKHYDRIEEITSRMSGKEVASVLQKGLKRQYQIDGNTEAYDFVLASNMISVGVDVSRLGLMVVMGQPKTNAEYIQATSRIGRDKPGLAVVVYNPARSRDRSHYEQFQPYHAALYRYVEATSLTPFADRAREKGLAALYVTLCRYLVPGLLKNDAAGKFNETDRQVQEAAQIILGRLRDIDPDELEATARELSALAEKWAQRAGGTLAYKKYGNKGNSLLKQGLEEDAFRVMNSLRNVDAQAGIYLWRE